MKNMTDITGVDLKVFVKKVYDLSVPQGLGFLHYQEGSLTETEIDVILSYGNDRIAIDMDYIKGRACKMIVFKENNRLFICDGGWYDHTDVQLKELLSATLPKDKQFSVRDINEKHIISCNCKDCRRKK